MDVDLDSRTALVTGAGRGNGKATAKLLASNGANVVANDLDQAPAEAVVADIREEDGDAIAVAADVSDRAEVEAMFDVAEETFGTVDVLVNNAGFGKGDRFVNEPSNDLWRETLETHLFGTINCTRRAVTRMRERGYGKIVNVTSIHTKNGVGMSPQYDVAKFSILGLTKSLALELGREGIRVNAVAPGWVDTRLTDGFDDRTREKIVDLNPLGRFAEPEEVAQTIAFLCSPASDYVNGHELRVDGGQVPIDNWTFRYEG
ncbi:SDR family NAD(P)-dependent oxidoreductase [Halosolutus gelatinilyticus]|uniref:SDR family NAD(P)-dependent oxidoreductase n=1 Tax=Halosolutus gelatinilyticus TaxID=2931975 RepID=UPI001FF13DA2|nr:SDR family NAD(P)-dependent oxidoreductase [Halosolutus gelatinilyticus]